MARRRSKKSRGSRKMTMPLAVVAPVALLGYDIATDVLGGQMDVAKAKLTGVTSDGRFDPKVLVKYYGPILAGVVVHKAAGMFGVNRVIANARIPFIRI